MTKSRGPGRARSKGVQACLVLLLSASSAASAQQGAAGPHPVFSGLEGSWVGEGLLFGQPAAFEMSWTVGESGFVYLSFSNASVGEAGNVTPILSARATYLVRGDSASGVWIDDRPQRLTLEAALTDSTVVTDWTAETERGRTEYRLVSPESVVVRDLVLQRGEYVPFGEATYERGQAGGRD